MSSKRSKRRKRKEAFRNYDPVAALPNESKKEPVVKEEPVVKLPGQWQVRVGGALLLVGGFLSALVVWYSMNQIKGMSPEAVTALTAAYGDTPMSYMVNVALTSITAVFQFAFGYPIFKNARNPFFAKKAFIMATIMLIIELTINIYTMSTNSNGFNVGTLLYGCIFPLMIMYGAYKNMKFAKAHPNYVPPAPTQMF